MTTFSPAKRRIMITAKEESLDQVMSGYYRTDDVNPASESLVSEGLAFAVESGRLTEQPMLLIAFIRIAELYPEVKKHLEGLALATLTPELGYALEKVLQPPEELKNGNYVPLAPSDPEEMDLCWGEFLVTGDVKFVKRIVEVLDKEDLVRRLLNELVSETKTNALSLDEEQLLTLQETGILIGVTDEKHVPHVATAGDVDLLIWRAVQEKHEASVVLLKQLAPEQILYVATKGTALWSLQSNAKQHDRVRLLCNQEATKPGGEGRRWLAAVD
ncbi:MAG: hypothetical protein GY822_08990 [Deltaproteobacteria bacterium]|nr:hypothetical protein [Deltaproteobacteria bacterium]